MDIFIAKLNYETTEMTLKEAFEQYGNVSQVKIPIDKNTRKNKGYGFITMPDRSEAKFAIESLNGSELDGRKIMVTESQPGAKRPKNKRK